jgi:hypothetical protein
MHKLVTLLILYSTAASILEHKRVCRIMMAEVINLLSLVFGTAKNIKD